MSENRRSRFSFTLSQVNQAVSMFIAAVVAISLLLIMSFHRSVAIALFLVATTCAMAVVATPLGYPRSGAVAGLIFGIAYVAWLFILFDGGGHWPGIAGWPFWISLE